MSGAGDIEIARVEKNSRETLIFALQTFKGHRLVSVRAWVRTETGDEIPTKNGLSIRIDLLGDVRKALEQVELAARDQGWLPANGEGA